MRKMKATLKGRYEANKGATAVSTLAVNAGDVRIKASMTDATFIRGPSLNGLALSVEKPGAFILDYHLPANDVRFQFMNSVRLMDKTVNLTYIHAQGSNRTTLDGSVAFNPSDKVNVSYTFGEPSACKVKYVYAHGELGRTVLEPCYDVSKNAWDFAVTRKFEEGDSLKATYHTSTNNLDLEWCRDPKDSGSFKGPTMSSAMKKLQMVQNGRNLSYKVAIFQLEYIVDCDDLVNVAFEISPPNRPILILGIPLEVAAPGLRGRDVASSGSLWGIHNRRLTRRAVERPLSR
ncbi:hypothetical protein ZIOFF_052901 [Zingiber officinale]|uniref:Uncharacterized protein n=1 Tax=Zingiber officinale TaxID=94328 RepID=A0A8J5KLL6_ZINOF|nr:hypothetical protein ZIOFF_052901 [Zingiber officinale]